MSSGLLVADLIVLAADKNIQFTIQSLINRRQSLDIGRTTFKIYTHEERDPGCLHRSDAFLQPFVKQFSRALVVFDREGCGKEQKTREELEEEVTERLSRSGWEDRAACIVIDPELENWVFSDSPEVDSALGWSGKTPPLRSWLKERGLLEAGQMKPSNPKEAMEAALRNARLPRSSSIYEDLMKNVSLNRCTDRSFLKLKATLQSWFPRESR